MSRRRSISAGGLQELKEFQESLAPPSAAADDWGEMVGACISFDEVHDGTSTGAMLARDVLVAHSFAGAAGSPQAAEAAPVKLLKDSTLAGMPGPNLSEELFVVPCSPLGTSGGTAGFFNIRYRMEKPVPDGYIGKDASRAICEVQFYDSLRQAAAESSAWARLKAMMCDCPGVALLPCLLPNQPRSVKRCLLLLENLRAGFDKLRLCDIKIGEETAVANWKGKSWVSAWSNHIVDERTNSAGEGLRLEGMDCPPPGLVERLSAVTSENHRANYMQKQILGAKCARRLILQRLQARDFLPHWLDLSSQGPGYEERTHAVIFVALREMTLLLRRLAAAPWPQPWIGSSVGLGLEAGKLTKEPAVFVKLFDWGRSDLYDEESFTKLSSIQRKDCIRRWQQYLVACSRLHWELARIAAHRCCSRSFSVVVFELCLEPTTLLQALITGGPESMAKQRTEVICVALAELRPQLDLDLPLAQTAQSSRLPEPGPAPRLRARLEQTVGADGAGTLRLQLRRICDHRHGVATDILFVRTIAFEDVDDARQHVEARRAGQPDPLPRCHACAQSSDPGRQEGNDLVWDSTLEFIGLGAQADAAEERLREAMPECFEGQPPQGGCGTDRADALTEGMAPQRAMVRGWPEDLPPPFLNLPDAWEHWSRWSGRLVPWLREEGGCPAAWRSWDTFKENELIECWSVSQNRWISAQVIEADLVELQYPGPDGLPVSKRLPAGHRHLKPMSAARCSIYVIGDDVQCYSGSQGVWLKGQVVETDLVIVAYMGPEGIPQQKQLPASSEHLRRPKRRSGAAGQGRQQAEQRQPNPPTAQQPQAQAQAQRQPQPQLQLPVSLHPATQWLAAEEASPACGKAALTGVTTRASDIGTQSVSWKDSFASDPTASCSTTGASFVGGRMAMAETEQRPRCQTVEEFLTEAFGEEDEPEDEEDEEEDLCQNMIGMSFTVSGFLKDAARAGQESQALR